MIQSALLIIFEAIFSMLTLGLFIPIMVFFVECTAALFSRRQLVWKAMESRPRVDVLVPAHNEASGITATIKSLLPQLIAQDRLVVIADNCDDETAVIARTLGATVIERYDHNHWGKGYALDYALQFIAVDLPEVVVMIDADCIVAPDAIERLVSLAYATARPVQASYLMKQPFNPGSKDAVSLLAVIVKNLVRPSGLYQLGVPCLLTGSGMAFPWSTLSKVSLASGSIAEDMQLAVELAIAGHTPVFCSEAKVTALLPQQKQVAKSQRRRWEHGHLQILLTQVPRLLKAAVRQKRFELLAIALDLCVPPLSLLVLLWTVAMVGALSIGGLNGSWTLTIILIIEALLVTLSTISAWAKFGRADISLQTLLTVPLYIFWKIPLYFAFLVQPQTKWIRTERDKVDEPQP